jgi:hypothetical protein
MRTLWVALLALACEPRQAPPAAPAPRVTATAQPESACAAAQELLAEAQQLAGAKRYARALVIEQRARTTCPAKVSAGWELRLTALTELGLHEQAQALARELGGTALAARAASVLAAQPSSFGSFHELLRRSKGPDGALWLDRALVQLEREQGDSARVELRGPGALNYSVSPNGEFVAMLEQQAISIYSDSAKREVKRLPAAGPIVALRFVEGRLLVASRREPSESAFMSDLDVSGLRAAQVLEVWDTTTWKSVARVAYERIVNHDGTADPPRGAPKSCDNDLCVSPDGKLVALAEMDVTRSRNGAALRFERAQVFRIEPWTKLYELAPPRCRAPGASCKRPQPWLESNEPDEADAVAMLAVDAAGKTLVVTWTSGSMTPVDLASGRALAEVPDVHELIAISPGGRYLFSRSSEDSLGSVWDRVTRTSTKLATKLSCHGQKALFSPDARWLFLPGSNFYLCSWDTQAKRFARTMPWPTPSAQSQEDEGTVEPDVFAGGGKELFVRNHWRVDGRFAINTSARLFLPEHHSRSFTVERPRDGSVALFEGPGRLLLEVHRDRRTDDHSQEPGPYDENNGQVTGPGGQGELLFRESYDDAEPHRVLSTRTGEAVASVDRQVASLGLTPDEHYLIDPVHHRLLDARSGKPLKSAVLPEFAVNNELGADGASALLGSTVLHADGSVQFDVKRTTSASLSQSTLTDGRFRLSAAERRSANGKWPTELFDLQANAVVGEIETKDVATPITIGPGAREVLLYERFEARLLVWHPFEKDETKAIEVIGRPLLGRRGDVVITSAGVVPLLARFGSGRRLLGAAGFGAWLLPFGAAAPAWEHWSSSPITGLCLLQAEDTVALVRDSFELVALDLATGRKLASFDAGQALHCDAEGRFALRISAGGVTLFRGAPLGPALELAAINPYGAREQALVGRFADGRFDFNGPRQLALSALGCQVGDVPAPIEACAERFESPGLLSTWLK